MHCYFSSGISQSTSTYLLSLAVLLSHHPRTMQPIQRKSEEANSQVLNIGSIFLSKAFNGFVKKGRNMAKKESWLDHSQEDQLDPGRPLVPWSCIQMSLMITDGNLSLKKSRYIIRANQSAVYFFSGFGLNLWACNNKNSPECMCWCIVSEAIFLPEAKGSF